MPEMRFATVSSGRALAGRRRRSGDRAGSPAGFTIIEVLIAAFLLLMIAIGVLPLFTRSIISNAEGFDHSQVANYARTRAEEFFQLPWDSDDLTLSAGTERVFPEYYSLATREWLPGAVPDGDSALWTRTTTIRQFSVTDLTAPLADTAPAANVHLKEITVAVESARGGPLGVGKRITVRLYKSQ